MTGLPIASLLPAAQAAAVPAGMPMVPFWAVAVWLGACLGSFANVLVYRLPRNLSIVGPRSFCPGCGSRVAWYDNVPLLSWIVLRGRCRRCGGGIPVRYPLLEAAGALCLVAGLLRFGWTVHGLAAGLLLLLLLVIALVDWEHMIIPHTLTVAGTVIGLAASVWSPPGLHQALLGVAAGAGSIITVTWVYKAVRGVVGMGGGDVMLMGMLGAFVGPWGVMAVLFAGALLGTVYAVVAGRGRVDGSSKLPFGTFLAAGGAVVHLWGGEIFAWYLGAF